MNNELKPCPFCGGKAIIAKAHPSFMLKKLHDRYVFAGCTQCKVVTPLFEIIKTGSPLMNEHSLEDAEQQAMETWNYRIQK